MWLSQKDVDLELEDKEFWERESAKELFVNVTKRCMEWEKVKEM